MILKDIINCVLIVNHKTKELLFFPLLFSDAIFIIRSITIIKLKF